MSTLISTAARTDLGAILARECETLLKGEGDVFVVVPNQLTLETEMELLGRLKLNGSFRLNVVSPKRLADRVFSECGASFRTVIDERGRAMLMGYLLRQHEKELKWFVRTSSRPGFESKLVEEISNLRQAGVRAEDLSALCDKGLDSQMNAKLSDISLMYAVYEERLSGLIQDGEQELFEAAERMKTCEPLKNSCAILYGFDITTHSVNLLTAALASVCRETRVLMPRPTRRDGDNTLYEPLDKSIRRLGNELARQNIPYEIKDETGLVPLTDTQRVISRLYTMNVRAEELKGGKISARRLKNPLDEARFVASRIRETVRKQKLRYSDVSVIVDEPEAYEDVLSQAFDEYSVPYFSQASAAASAHPLCRFLNETLMLLSGKATVQGALWETGFTPLTQDEEEALLGYCESLRLSPGALLKPFTRGSADMISQAEPIRKKLAEPIGELAARLKEASTLKEQLTYLYNYLEDGGCFEKNLETAKQLENANEFTLSQDEIRIRNLLIDTFDQMNEILGPEPLRISAMADMIRRALETVVIKVLPQSPDAVQVSGPQRCGMKPVRAVFLMHAVAAGASGENGILDDRELSSLSDLAGVYLAPSLMDLARTQRMYTRDALMLATDSVTVTYPAGGMDGSALAGGALISELKRAVKDFKVLGGVGDDADTARLRLTSPKGALNYVSSEFAYLKANAPVSTALKLMDKGGKLDLMRDAASYTNEGEDIGENLSAQLYAKSTGVSKLERYAGCPFSHFVEQGLRPITPREFKIDPMNRGVLLHECVEMFLKSEGLSGADEEFARNRMNEIFDAVLGGEIAPYAADGNAAKYQISLLRRAAARAAVLLLRQLRKGVFRPVGMELSFGRDGKSLLRLSDGIRLDGRIDRVDLGVHAGEKYVFVVDYKTGHNKIEPAKLKAGIQLQLMIYLAEAMSRFNAKSAGVYYFMINDEPVKDESTDPNIIEEKRVKEMRMSGITPDDVSLIRDISDEPQNVINVDFNKNGSLRDGNHANQTQFERLVRYAFDQCLRFNTNIMKGDTSVSPAVSSGFDACTYCQYAGICLKDRQIRGTRKRKLEKLNLKNLLEQIE